MNLSISDLRSPLGDLKAAWHDGHLCALAFTDHWQRTERFLQRRFGAIDWSAAKGADLRTRLDRYFAGDLQAIAGIEVDPGGTPFQQSVWRALRRIPIGSTTTYSALAREIGAPSAVRAVGAANGANPIWLIIPCHRAIGADGRLVGYAGGLERKQWLLEHEGALQPQSQLPLARATA
jgi:methylated-DNA-[protein]-cysteine S-methyltransferase